MKKKSIAILTGGGDCPGTNAVELIKAKKFGYMAAVKGNNIAAVSLEEIAKGPRNVPLGHPLIIAARSGGELALVIKYKFIS